MSSYRDDKITHIESDIEKIQVKPNMYISYSGSKGAIHLFKEAVNNAIDEGINPNSPCNKVDIYLNLKENSVMLKDNGRGIPRDDMKLACTKLQSGSKFSRATSLGSAGENGVGLTAMNALSENFTMISSRDGKQYTLSFTEGVQNSFDEEQSKEHGLAIIFKPSKRFLGKCNFILDEIESWLDDIQYMLPDSFKINLTVEKAGKEGIVKKTYRNKHGMSGVLDTICDNKLISKNIHLFNKTAMEEEATDYVGGKIKKIKVDRFLGIEFAFNYTTDIKIVDLSMRSFCNFVSTVDHGVHADAVKGSIQYYLSKATRDALSDKEAKKIDITFADVSNGLCIALYLSTDHQIHFASQTKEKVSNNDLGKPIRDLVTAALKKYFDNNPSELKKITNQVKANAKMRIAATTAKKSVLKDEIRGSLKDYAEKNFVPANNKGKKDYRELIIVEGDSAGALVKMGRFDPDTQALFFARGVPLNTHDLTVPEILDNAEIRTLITKLGCNVGDRFNIDNLWYDKIIIMSDADIDGNHIDSQYRLLFYKHLRPIVENGHLYKVITPLYRIKDKKKGYKFLLNKKELAERFNDNIKTHIKLIDPSGTTMRKSELADFLFLNTEYDEELTEFSSHRGINFKLIEALAMYWRDNVTISKLGKILNKRFKEVTINEDSMLIAIIDGQRQTVNLDGKLYKQLERLRQYIDLNKSPIYDVVIDGVEYKDLTISEIMVEASRYKPEDITRYKGIGELTADELREVAMNPNNRRLLRITIEDIERTDEVFEVLFKSVVKDNPIDRKRKKMMREFKISKHQLDN